MSEDTILIHGLDWIRCRRWEDRRKMSMAAHGDTLFIVEPVAAGWALSALQNHDTDAHGPFRSPRRARAKAERLALGHATTIEQAIDRLFSPTYRASFLSSYVPDVTVRWAVAEELGLEDPDALGAAGETAIDRVLAGLEKVARVGKRNALDVDRWANLQTNSDYWHRMGFDLDEEE